MTTTTEGRAGTVKAMTVRFSDRLHAMIVHESAYDGISVAQFVREATVARVTWRYMLREGSDRLLSVDEVAKAVAERLRLLDDEAND